ncbi:MAG: acetyl-CoA carboxylase biotin carboxyl carrier protein [Bacteroidales bacterium]|jgi:biotin carboxyl carrier protein|nr:acetyl-CoA carboxylase biotin carboxyl carrier protein subunit [Bacteroidales bacterium]
MKQYKFIINGNDYQVDILDIEDNIADVEVNGTPYKVELDKEMNVRSTPKIVQAKPAPSAEASTAAPKAASPASTGGEAIKSPLPGAIIDVYVNVGDTVKTGQQLLMLEAMKMENNIDSDRDGKILEVKVSKGDNVLEGDVLIVIE